MFSKAINFLDNLFLVYKKVIILEVIVLAFIFLIAYAIYGFLGIEIPHSQQFVVAAMISLVFLFWILFTSHRTIAFMTLLVLQCGAVAQVENLQQLKALATNHTYIFLLSVSIIWFLILGFQFSKKFFKGVAEYIDDFDKTASSKGFPFIFKSIAQVANFCIIVFLLGVEILVLFEAYNPELSFFVR